jgi:hypothetical protein
VCSDFGYGFYRLFRVVYNLWISPAEEMTQARAMLEKLNAVERGSNLF